MPNSYPPIGGLGGGVLTEEQELTFKYFKYSKIQDALNASRPVRTTLDSFFLGGQWALSSGGFDLYYTELKNSINFSTPRLGLKDQTIIANQDMSGVLPLSIPVPTTPLISAEFKGPAASSGSTEAADQFIILGNLIASGLDFIPEEVIETDDFLFYEVHVGTDATTDPVYSQKQTNRTSQPGDTFHWDFEHPLMARIDELIFQVISIAKGDQDATKRPLLIRPIITDPNHHYVKVHFRVFEDKLVTLDSDIDKVLNDSSGNSISDNNGNLLVSGAPYEFS